MLKEMWRWILIMKILRASRLNLQRLRMKILIGDYRYLIEILAIKERISFI
jgi:hypothetical protein